MDSQKDFLENGNINDNLPPNIRYFAVKILSRFDRSDSYIDKLITHVFKFENFNQADKGLLTELVNGVIRWRNRLDWILTGFYYGDYQKCLNIVKNALRVALYQILFLNRIPIPTAVNESVEIVKKIQGDKTAGIVNGVLRNISRNIENIRFPERSDDEIYYLSVMYSHPKWMVKRWVDLYGMKETEKLLDSNNRRPYVAVRVNNLRSNISEIEEILRQHNIEFTKLPFYNDSLILNSPKYDLASSDLFKTGKITIQDPAASMASLLAAPKENSLVLDMCAAPGGKSFLLAEQMKNNGKIIALDRHESKLRFIREGAERLGLDIINVDTADSTEYTYNEKFDLIFCDVPCSGLGTLSKKPDIKWKREQDEITNMVQTQRLILENAVNLLKDDGVIVYSTCTFEPEENQNNIKWFLENHPDFKLDPAENYLSPDVCHDGFYEVFPHKHNIDGAFAARLVKK